MASCRKVALESTTDVSSDLRNELRYTRTIKDIDDEAISWLCTFNGNGV
jgi:hypothetical protein